MVKIRLRRVGTKKQPKYRVVVADARAPRDGAFIEVIGHYNPLTEPTTFTINEEKALNWLNKGAQPTETVAGLLSKLGVLERFGGKTPPTMGKPQEKKASTRRANKDS